MRQAVVKQKGLEPFVLELGVKARRHNNDHQRIVILPLFLLNL
jgi:hypothetical protein